MLLLPARTPNRTAPGTQVGATGQPHGAGGLQVPSQPLQTRADWAARVGDLAFQALVQEVETTPKPGLVDRRNSGAHKDMTLATFYASADALAPWLPAFVLAGCAGRHLPPEDLLARLRSLGQACEQSMFQATAGINTHKGSVFSLGLLCGAAGRLHGSGILPDQGQLCREVARITSGLVQRELVQDRPPATAGERSFQEHGLTGARGEAASGFATVRHHALPALHAALAQGLPEEEALVWSLLQLLAVNPDTNLVQRGGLAGLTHVRTRARALLAAGFQRDLQSRMEAFDDDLIARNLSPGGSADLLAVTWFLSRFPEG